MTLSSRERRDWRIILGLSLGSAAISAVFGYLMGEFMGPDTPIRGATIGVACSVAIATPILLFEIKWQRLALFRRLRRLPLLSYFGVRVLFYSAVIVGGLAIVFLLFGDADRLFGATFLYSVAFSVVVVVLLNVIIEMGLLLGYGTLKSLLTGRYVRAKSEQRAFLLIDMKNSTGLAEHLGPIRFHELLNAFFRNVADAALQCGAEIHKYVGDEAILTWPDETLSEGDCLACPFIARDLIAADDGFYRRRFGVVPEFRAAVHCGEIVAGEIGDVRREIAYVGDTLNVTARLLDASKTMGHDVMVSTDVLEHARLPPDLEVEPLPKLTVRGRAAPLGVSALRRAA